MSDDALAKALSFSKVLKSTESLESLSDSLRALVEFMKAKMPYQMMRITGDDNLNGDATCTEDLVSAVCKGNSLKFNPPIGTGSVYLSVYSSKGQRLHDVAWIHSLYAWKYIAAWIPSSSGVSVQFTSQFATTMKDYGGLLVPSCLRQQLIGLPGEFLKERYGLEAIENFYPHDYSLVYVVDNMELFIKSLREDFQSVQTCLNDMERSIFSVKSPSQENA